MSENPHDDLTELESAIHYLKEAQQLHNEDEYDEERENAALEQIDKALDEIDKYVVKEKVRTTSSTIKSVDNGP